MLRKQLDKTFKSLNISSHPVEYLSGPRYTGPSCPPNSSQRDIRTLLDELSLCTTSIGIDAALPRIFESGRQVSETESGSNRDIRALLDAVSGSLAPLDLPSLRAYESASTHRGRAAQGSGNEEGNNLHILLDRMTTQKHRDILADRFYYSPPPPPPKEYITSTWRPGHRSPETAASSGPINNGCVNLA